MSYVIYILFLSGADIQKLLKKNKTISGFIQIIFNFLFFLRFINFLFKF